jgi:hypothetical protein
MAGCILHFGMHKTGSSSIQESLVRELDDPGFHYCALDDTGTGNASGPLLRAFLTDPQSHPILRLHVKDENPELTRQRIIARLRASLEQASTKTVIISAEGLCHLGAEEISALISLIREYTAQITAVAYVRPPHSFMQSAFAQRLSYLSHKSPIVRRLYPNYQSRFEKIIAAVGQENVRFWLYDPAMLQGGCVVRDFCARIGIVFNAERGIRSNQGISASATQLLYAYRATNAGQEPNRNEVLRFNRVVDAVRRIEGPKMEFHPQFFEYIIAEKAEDIAWMERHLGASLRNAEPSTSPNAIQSESDLLRFSPEALDWVRARDPSAALRQDVELTPRYIGACLEAIGSGPLSALMDGPAPNAAQLHELPVELTINPREIIRSLSERGRLPSGVSEVDCERLLIRALRELSGRFRREGWSGQISGLGRFEQAGSGSWYFAPEHQSKPAP